VSQPQSYFLIASRDQGRIFVIQAMVGET